MDAAAHGSQFHPERGPDLLVGQALDVAQHHCGAKFRRQGVQGRLKIWTETRVVVDLLRRGPVGRHPVVVLRECVHADARPATDHVQEQVRGNPVQPTLEGSGLVVLQRLEHPDECLLGEVLGVVLISRQPVGKPVDPVGVLTYQFVPGRHGRSVAGRIEHSGAVQLLRRHRRTGSGSRQCGGRRILLVSSGRQLNAAGWVNGHNSHAMRGIPVPSFAARHGLHLSRSRCATRMSKLNVI